MEKQISLKDRSFNFSLKTIDFLKLLPKDYIYQTIGKQLLRSATSIGANIIEAQAGSSKKEFINYYHISLKSGNETVYWLKILKERIISSITSTKIEELLTECMQLNKILASSLLTLKGKRSF